MFYRAIGSVTVNLATLAQRQVLNLEEPLVDANKMVTNVSGPQMPLLLLGKWAGVIRV